MGAFEEALRLIDSTLQLLPPEKTRDRAEALDRRAQALWGLGRIDDANAAWKGAIQRYDELGDHKSASAMHRRIAHLEARHEAHDGNGAGPAEVAATAEVELANS